MDQKSRKIDTVLAAENVAVERAKEFFIDIMKNSRDVLYRYNPDTQSYDYLSNSIESITGYTPREIMNAGIDLLLDVLHPDDKKNFLEVYKGLLNGAITDSTIRLEYRTRHKDGHYRWYSDTINIVRDENNVITAAIGKICDITSLKQHQEAFRDRESCLKRLADAAFDAIVIHHKGSKLVDVNRQFLDMFGYTLEEVKKASSDETIAPQSRDFVHEKMAACYQEGYQAFGRRKDGTIFPVQIQGKESLLDGETIRITAIRDMTREQQQSELLGTVLECSQDCIIVVDRNYNNLYVNRAALKQVNISSDQGGGKTIYDSLGHMPEMLQLWKERIDKVFQAGMPICVQDEGFIDSRYVCSESILSPIRYPNGEMFAVSIVYRDVTARKQLQEHLEKSEQKYKQLYEDAPVALFRSALDGTLLNCNRACLVFFGHSVDEPPENYLNKVCVTDYYFDKNRRREFVETLKKSGCVNHFEVRLKHADGSVFWASISASLYPEAGYIEGTMYDITLKKMLTKAERKILNLLIQGLSNKQIAKKLARSVRTVEDHRASIMRKLNVDNAFDLAKKTMNYNFEETSKKV